MRIIGAHYGAVFLALILLSCTVDHPQIDVENFYDRRENCEHFRGEFPDPPDPERVKELIDGVNEYCTGTDAQLAALKIRYADNPAIMVKLNAYESRIERNKRP